MIPDILESGGAKSRSSLQRSLYSTSSSPSSSSRMFDAETMEEDLNEVRELPLELLNSDIGEMHEERPGGQKNDQNLKLETERKLTGHGGDAAVTVAVVVSRTCR